MMWCIDRKKASLALEGGGGGIRLIKFIYKNTGDNMERRHNPNLTENARNLRKNMTKEERHLWYDFLKNYPVRFLRQKVIDNYIADFYCRKAGIVIELDGSQHYEEKAMLKDKIRTQRIEKWELTVIRIPNNEVNNRFNEVCDFIDNKVKESLSQPF